MHLPVWPGKIIGSMSRTEIYEVGIAPVANALQDRL